MIDPKDIRKNICIMAKLPQKFKAIELCNGSRITQNLGAIEDLLKGILAFIQLV